MGGIGIGGKKQQQPAGVDPEVAKKLQSLLPGNNKIFKMLEKMGFKNRLGKNEDGLATALAPTMLDAGQVCVCGVCVCVCVCVHAFIHACVSIRTLQPPPSPPDRAWATANATNKAPKTPRRRTQKQS